MERKSLYVTVISARDLKDVRHVFDMNPYVVASLSGGERYSNEQRTPAHRDGGTSPRWNHALAVPFTVVVAAARAGLLTLELRIKTERTFGGREIGRVDVPVGVLLEQGGDDGETRAMSYAVSTGGVLEFSYRFGESILVHGAAPDQRPVNQPPRMAGLRSVGRQIFEAAMPAVIWSAMSDASGDD